MRRKNTSVGRPILHGGFSTQPPGELLKGRARRRLREYLTRFRPQLVEDVADSEERLTAGQIAVLDRAVSKLAIIRLIEHYIVEAGPFEALGVLRPVIIGPYMTLTRELRLDLQALGLERKRAEERALTPAELAELIDKDAESEYHPGDS